MEQQGQPDDWCEAEWLAQGYSWNPVTQAWVHDHRQDWQDCSWQGWQDWQDQQPVEQQGQPDDWCEAEWLAQGYSWNPVTQAWVLEG